MDLAAAAGVTAEDRVLDIGSGLGGPARLLARQVGCHVVGLDLTPELCEVATDLTRRVHLEDRVEIRQGDALDLPFDDGSFDLAWTQHASMNIADKPRLYAETRRILRPGGRLALFDIIGATDGPLHLPVPWAEDASVSALIPTDELRTILTEAGFTIRTWDDLTEDAAAFYPALPPCRPRRRPSGSTC